MSDGEKLALHGGPKAKTTPYGTGQRYMDNELKYLQEALEQNTLFYGHGQMVKRACEKMCEYTGMPYAVACSSGSSSIHLGLIACGIGPGDEVITTPNTDSGTVLGVIEEGAVPVFCDCEEHLQPSARTVAAKITEHTRAVIVVHLAGRPAPVDEIVELCRDKGIGVVEDCAQSWGAKLNSQQIGSFGDAGCFSTNDYKHISTGDGGFVVLRDEALYRRVSNYSDKHYDRLFDGAQRQAHQGMNYRMGELQGAVALAQLEKVDQITGRMHDLGDRLAELLGDLEGGRMATTIPGGYSTYWWQQIEIDPEAFTVSRDELLEAIQAEGVGGGTYAHYDLIQKKLFQERVVRPWLDDWRRHYPFQQPDGREYFYNFDDTPIHARLLQNAFMMSFGAFYTDQDIEEMAAGVRKVFRAFRR